MVSCLRAGPKAGPVTKAGDAPVGFLPRWIIMVAAGEALGFLIPASMGAWLGLTGAPDTVVYPAMIAAGACEGALLGYGQWLGFGRGVVSRVPWIVATSAGAAVAWSLGMFPGIQGGLDISSPPTLALVTGGAMLLLVTIPSLQWLVLRRGGSQTLRWIPVNAGAWAAGLLWTIAPSPIVDERTPAPLMISVYAVAGLLMAVTVAALTGPTARRIATGLAR